MRNLIIKIKEKGFWGIVRGGKNKICYWFNKKIYHLYKLKPINNYSIVLESEGDLSDNAYALFYYMKENGYIGKYNITWLVDHIENYKNEKYIKYASKDVGTKINLNTLRALATCKWYIFDHCNLFDSFNGERKKGQKVIYLCHGYAGFKAPKGGKRDLGDEIINTGEIPRKGTYDFSGKNVNVQILGFSRLDWFYSDLTSIQKILEEKFKLKSYKKIFLWMPTFRKSDRKLLSEDYLDDGTGLPLLDSVSKYIKLNEFLKKNECLCILKLHHLQAELELFKKDLSNIIIIRDEDLKKLNIQLYQFIPCSDALITDYSSVSTDYLLLDKPIIYILDDYEKYNKSRGIYPDNALDLMPGSHVYSISELYKAMQEVIENKDIYRKERRKLTPYFHKYQDGRSSERILKHLNINGGY